MTAPSDVPREALVPLAPFDPPIRDAGVVALLKGLNPPSEPVPTHTSSTDGELSATFAAGPRVAPSAVEIAPPEASVVIGPDRPAKKKKPSPEKLSTTFQVRPKKPSLLLPMAVAVLVGGGGAGVWVWLHATGRLAGALPAPSAEPLPPLPPPGAAPPVPVQPIAQVAPVPVPTPPASAPPLDVIPPAPSASAAPPVKPAKLNPSRRKEDEPDRIL